jgi:hypothetical protein
VFVRVCSPPLVFSVCFFSSFVPCGFPLLQFPNITSVSIERERESGEVKMSKKKLQRAVMTLKDFHGGSIPSALPLPSAPGM